MEHQLVKTFYKFRWFYRVGDGPRKTGFTSNNGGQFRMSFLKKFENGSFRIYGKLLDDRTAAYMPMPMKVTEVTLIQIGVHYLHTMP